MSKIAYENMLTARENAVNEFQLNFNHAKDCNELLQAYAHYVGKLEAILDAIEVTQKRR